MSKGKEDRFLPWSIRYLRIKKNAIIFMSLVWVFLLPIIGVLRYNLILIPAKKSLTLVEGLKVIGYSLHVLTGFMIFFVIITLGLINVEKHVEKNLEDFKKTNNIDDEEMARYYFKASMNDAIDRTKANIQPVNLALFVILTAFFYVIQPLVGD